MDRIELTYRLKQMEEVNKETHSKVVELEHKLQELEKYVHLVMRGPKGDKGDGCDLTEEDIKNAVRDGVVEGLQEYVEGLKYQGARRF